MDESQNDQRDTSDRELVATRFFDAPRELVWKVWIDPKHITHWWGPNGFTSTIHAMDVKPGGVWEFIMHGPNGVDYPNKVIYEEVVKPERLVYKHVAPAFRVTVTFSERGGKTKLVMQMLFETRELRDAIVKSNNAEEGLNQNLDRLVRHVAAIDPATHTSHREVFFTRVFNAPRQLVFDAWTDSKHVTNWWGPKGFTNPVCEVDARPGGKMTIDMKGPNGVVYPMVAEFKEVTSPERLVFVSSALGQDRKQLFDVLTTVTFEESDGKTVLTVHASVTDIYDDQAKQHISGMEMGWSQTLDRLQENVESTTARR